MVPTHLYENGGNRSASTALAFISLFSIILLLLTGCTDETITIKKLCSRNDTYCEDQAKQAAPIVYENITTVLDTRSSDNQVYYENITP